MKKHFICESRIARFRFCWCSNPRSTVTAHRIRVQPQDSTEHRFQFLSSPFVAPCKPRMRLCNVRGKPPRFAPSSSTIKRLSTSMAVAHSITATAWTRGAVRISRNSFADPLAYKCWNRHMHRKLWYAENTVVRRPRTLTS